MNDIRNDMTRPNTPRVCFIGFGEAGQALASGLRDAGVKVLSAWDILFPVPAGEPLRAAAERIGVRRGASAGDAVRDADLIVAAVTATSSLEAAQAAKPFLRHDQYYLDINSVSPTRKQDTGKLIGDAARYVDVAVMAPVHPARHQTPTLLAGPHAASLEPILLALDMKVSIAAPTVGAAAAIKMVRSVMVKGLEALTLECFLAAHRTGVEDQIVASLSKSFPGLDWPALVEYNLERMANHGTRRAHEMEEVADTLRELGIDPHMTAGTIRRQQEMGELGRHEPLKSAVPEGRLAMLDAIGKALIDGKPSH
jgi:3-hydroxyisobutyrate dehydrogenase-like beta-hydroxyacid dehydrogenase